MTWPDIVIFGLIGIVIAVNTLYGLYRIIGWIWKKVKKWIFNIK